MAKIEKSKMYPIAEALESWKRNRVLSNQSSFSKMRDFHRSKFSQESHFGEPICPGIVFTKDMIDGRAVQSMPKTLNPINPTQQKLVMHVKSIVNPANDQLRIPINANHLDLKVNSNKKGPRAP